MVLADSVTASGISKKIYQYIVLTTLALGSCSLARMRITHGMQKQNTGNNKIATIQGKHICTYCNIINDRDRL